VGRRRGGRLAAAGALLLFGGAASLPLLAPGQLVPPWVEAARRTSPVPLASAPAALPAVKLSAVAQPVRPQDSPAATPSGDSTHLAALVAAEDLRLRTLLHHANRLTAPLVIPVRGGLPTLVLPGRPGPYGIADLTSTGAAIPLGQGGGYLLVDSVLLTQGAVLQLGGPGLRTLLMDSSTAGFTSIVVWGGTLTLAGASGQAPLAITGWDRAANQPAVNHGYGRPYIRAVGARMELRNVRAASLGFWSGRTGGVAWTGISSASSTGGAWSSTFTSGTYGAFVSRGAGVTFSDDLFEANELDGLRLHRGAAGSTVTASAAARNGANGFVVSRGATGDALHGDLAVNNRGNGFFLNGQALVNGASPSGGQVAAATGLELTGSDAEANGRTGILVEGGAGTVLQGNTVCASITGIAVRAGATGVLVDGNEVRCGGRLALSIGPSVTGTTVAGNTLSNARIGLLVRNSPGVRILDNRITGMSVFAISVRGASPGVVGSGNVVSGRGFQPIDVRGGAPAPLIEQTDVRGWQHRSELTPLGYLRYHPILATWLGILGLVALCASLIRLRRRPKRPYHHELPWQPTASPEQLPETGFATGAAWVEPVAAAVARAKA